MHHIRSSFLLLAVTASLLFGAGISVTPASAGQVLFNFTGEVDRVHPSLLGIPPDAFIVDGNSSAMSGSMLVDMFDTNGLANRGSYNILNFDVNIEGYEATMGSSGVVRITNLSPDRFFAAVDLPVGPTVNTFTPRVFELDLRGPSNTFLSDALPTSSPSLDSFTHFNRWSMIFGPNGDGRAVLGNITAITASPVPLPASVILFGAGLVALIGLGAGNWRKQNNNLA